MLDLGTSFIASTARDPNAIAIVDADQRLTYQQWYRRISSVVAAFDDIGLRPGDHIVTHCEGGGRAALGAAAAVHAGFDDVRVYYLSFADSTRRSANFAEQVIER